MQPGTVIANRFRLVALAGTGGMGAVYRAMDEDQGVEVAVKILQNPQNAEMARRFLREAEALQGELQAQASSGIVEYIAHGVTQDGLYYLVMEWLDGRDLEARIRVQALSEMETIQVGVQLCQALAAVHGCGLLHRDIKPGNVWLVGGEIGRLKLIDFGLVRFANSNSTKSGNFLGTPSYVSPEQAQGWEELDPRADLYAVGAVLFACLTRRPPFTGEHVVAVVAKLLLEQAPRVSEFRSGVSPDLEDLIAQLLSKSPDERPGSAEAVVTQLRAIASRDTDSMAERREAGPLSHAEQRFVSVLLIDSAAAFGDSSSWSQVEEVAAEHDAVFERLEHGTAIAVFSAEQGPVAAATRAAHCALSLPEARAMVIATGRSMVDRRQPVGEAIDRAASLLFAGGRTQDAGVALDATPRQIMVDRVSATLLADAFEIEQSPGSDPVLVGVKSNTDRMRAARQMQGREAELDALHEIVVRCIEEPAARAVLVTGETGAGKSHLVRAFAAHLGAGESPPRIWTATSDPLSAGARFGLLAQLLRQAVGTARHQSLPERQRHLRQYIKRRIGTAPADAGGDSAPGAGGDAADKPPGKPADEATGDGGAKRIAMFLGELADTPFADDELPQLREARRLPRIMHDQMLLAWQDWLAAELRAGPVVCVLEDLHWGDVPTVRFVAAALHYLAQSPLLIVATARPDVTQIFPDLWSAARVEHIALEPLGERACATIARRLLLDSVPDHLVAQIVSRAEGNPFYVEELARAAAAGRLHETPDTVLATVSIRLAELSPQARRALRAASVFGHAFWRDGVAALLAVDASHAGTLIAELESAGLAMPSRPARFPMTTEHHFHHDLVREAAYATLTDRDRARAHRAAAVWLSSVGEREPLILAEHFWRGQALDKALPWFHRGAKRALEGEDLAAVIHCADRAVACGADGNTLGALRLLQAEALNWQAEHNRAIDRGDEALQRLSPGSSQWAHAAHQISWAASHTGKHDRVVATVELLLRHLPDHPDDFYFAAVCSSAAHLAGIQRSELDRVTAAALEVLLREREPSPVAAAWAAESRGFVAAFRGRYDVAAGFYRQAIERWRALGNQRNACFDLANLGGSLSELGDYEQCIWALREARASAQRLGLEGVSAYATSELIAAMARSGALEDAADMSLHLIHSGDSVFRSAKNATILAHIALLRGEPSGALELLERATSMTDHNTFPFLYAALLALRAQALLALGRAPDALPAAYEASAIADSLDALNEHDTMIRLAYVEVLEANGQHDRARQAIAKAKKRLLARAAPIESDEWWRSCLTRVPEHKRTLDLADKLLGPKELSRE